MTDEICRLVLAFIVGFGVSQMFNLLAQFFQGKTSK